MLKDIFRNPAMLTDSYNLSHPDFKENLDWETSHMYNREGEYGGMYLFGFSEIVNRILSIRIEKWMLDEANKYAEEMGLWFPYEMWMRIIDECDGYIPLHVESLPEGTWCPNGTPFAQIKNTKEGFGDFVTWYEGIFMMAYFPSACLTEAMKMREYLIYRKDQFGYDDSFMWRIHSFGFRGHRSPEDAYWTAMAWSIALGGSDDFHAKQHGAKIASIPALAHKVTQQFDKEYDCFKRAIDKTFARGKKVVSLVIDTYNADRFIKEYLLPLSLYAASKGLGISCRPDSGDTWKQAVDIYKIVKKNNLTNVTVLIGEGMSFENVKKCDEYMLQNGVPLNFILYGMGGGFYNHITRDTLGFAMKTAFSNGKPRMKFSMNSMKRSIPGEVALIKKANDMFAVNIEEDQEYRNLFKTIYHYDPNNDYIPIPLSSVAIWEDTKKRALEQDTSQSRIYISPKIQEMISEFERNYRG